MKSFQNYLDLISSNEPIVIASDWSQGRSIFGGLSAALILTKINESEASQGKNLKSLSVNFCGVFEADTECEIHYQILSNGKSVVQIQGQLLQDNQIRTQITACYGRPRESSINVKPEPSSPKGSIDDAMKFPFIPGLTPEFGQHIDLGVLNDCIPFSGVKTTHVTGWTKFKEAPREFNLAAVIALIDAWPPAVLPMLKKPAPASTITWNMEFTGTFSGLAPNDAIYYECDVEEASDGYAHTEAKIYKPNGELIALSRQLVGVYDKRS
jgi:acyl-CoA thioesterase